MAKYRITQDRWCWCGAAAALVVERSRDGEQMEYVCSVPHGQRSVAWLESGQVAGTVTETITETVIETETEIEVEEEK